MSRPLLEQLQEVLATLDELVSLGRERYDTDPLVRWSIQRLWIFAGNRADAHCQTARVAAGLEPWSELIAERNVLAHYLPDDLNDERVWFDTASDISDLRRQVNEAATRIHSTNQ